MEACPDVAEPRQRLADARERVQRLQELEEALAAPPPATNAILRCLKAGEKIVRRANCLKHSRLHYGIPKTL